MSRITILIILGFVIVSAVIIYSSFNFRQLTTKSLSQTPTPKTNTNSDLPVSIKNPYVKTALLSYFFEGKLNAIRTESSTSAVLVTEVSGSGVPSFTVSKNTKYLFYQKGHDSPAKFSDLKVGQLLRIHDEYDLIKNKWQIKNVRIKLSTPKK